MDPVNVPLARAVSIAVVNALEFHIDHPGEDVPWDQVRPCDYCNHKLTPADAELPLPAEVATMHADVEILIPPRMRPIVHAMLAHQDVCPVMTGGRRYG